LRTSEGRREIVRGGSLLAQSMSDHADSIIIIMFYWLALRMLTEEALQYYIGGRRILGVILLSQSVILGNPFMYALTPTPTCKIFIHVSLCLEKGRPTR
jgi:hypothetical protein